MHGSMNERATARSVKALWRAVLCAAAVSIATASYADDSDRSRGDKRRGEHRSWTHEHANHQHRHRNDDRRRREQRDHRRWDERYVQDWRRGYDRRSSRRDEWPPLQRYGHRCGDRRHYRGVHYHVLARDYYDYYYPRYRYYGHAPRDSHASVIITLPLF
jgi:hypothetical protein